MYNKLPTLAQKTVDEYREISPITANAIEMACLVSYQQGMEDTYDKVNKMLDNKPMTIEDIENCGINMANEMGHN